MIFRNGKSGDLDWEEKRFALRWHLTLDMKLVIISKFWKIIVCKYLDFGCSE